MKPILSVIVPVYNVEQYLHKCVESILNQTFKNIELILIDDGSTDISSQICDEYKEKDRRVCVYHKKNGGLSDARNYGIDHTNGEYIAFVDSDDWIDIGMYEAMMNAIVDNDADIVVCGHRVVTLDGQIEETVVFDKPILMSGKDATKEILRDESMPSFAWNKIYRKSLFKDIKFPKGRIYEDTAVIYRCFNMAKSVYVLNKVYYNYLRRPGSICLSQKGDIEKIVKRLFDNALAFFERYVFSKTNIVYESVLSVCAQKSIAHLQNIIHYCAKNGISYKSDYVQRALKMYRTVDIVNIEKRTIRISIEHSIAKINDKMYYLLVKLFYKIKK